MLASVNIGSSFRCLTAFVAAWYFFKHFVKPFLSPLRKIPGCPFKPIVGNLLESLREGANNNGIRWMQKYQSRIIRFYFLGGEGAVLVGDPSLAKHILVTNSKNYHRSTNRMLEKLVPGFLALLNGEEHHALRRLVSPVFNSAAVEGFIPVFEKTARKVVKAWSEILGKDNDSAEVNAQDYMTRLTLDAICQCGFQYEMNAVETHHSREMEAFKHVLGGLEVGILQMLSLNWLPTKKNRRIWSNMEIFRSTISQVISSKQEKMHEGVTTHDILSRLLEATDENGQHLSKDNIFSQVGGFLSAGFETTNVTLTFTLLSLAEHPEEQEKVRKEVLSLIPDKNQPITPKIVESLSYLTCAIKETLRLYPPLSTLFRRAQQDDYLQNYFIPAGTLVGINLGALHRLPELWSDPMTFKPERFQAEYDKYAFLPFVAGPYMCVGHLFSMTETITVLALILRNFRISLPDDYSWRIIRKLAIQPHPPLRLVVTPL